MMDFKNSPGIVQTTKSPSHRFTGRQNWPDWVKQNVEANGRGIAASNSWISGLVMGTDAETHPWMEVYNLERKTMTSIYGHADACGLSN